MAESKTLISFFAESVLRGKNEDEFFTCSIKEPKQGKQKIFLKEDYEGETYIIEKYKSQETIFFVKDYTKPMKSDILVDFDYNKTENGTFEIEFQNNLGEYRPPIKFDNISLPCEIKEDKQNILECPITKEYFPESTENEMVYEGNLINPIDEIDAKITIKIAKKQVSKGKYLFFNCLLMIASLLILV